MVTLLLAMLLTAEPVPSSAADAGPAVLVWSPIDITATPVPLNPDGGTKLEALTFRGALHLTSTGTPAMLGGLSALRFLNGQLYSVSDKGGNLFRLTLREVKGELVGVASAEMAHLGASADNEAIEFDEGMMITSSERTHSLTTFALTDAGISTVASTRTITGEAWGLEGNGGFEAFAARGGCALMFTEEAHTGYLGPLSALALPNLTELPWPEDFSPTDVTWASPTRAYVLLRKFKDKRSSAALGRLAITGCGQNRDVKFTPLATWTEPLLIDNMEGLAVVQGKSSVDLYVISDDNFGKHGPQRTLLLKFTAESR